MELLNFVLCVTFIISTNALPDTNIKIEHYDGPVYLGNAKPNCCPLCNSILKPENIPNENGNCETPEIVFPQTTIFIKSNENEQSAPCEKETVKLTIQADNCDTKNNINTYGIPENTHSTMLHTDTKVHKIPVTCRDTTARTYGNTYGTGNSLANHFGYDTYGTTSVTDTYNPLSNYLPINTASQNTCYQVPILTYNNNCNQGSDEPILVPQKFMYSLILDGDVAQKQNGRDCSCYYY